MITVISDRLFIPTHIFICHLINELTKTHKIKILAKNPIIFDQFLFKIKPNKLTTNIEDDLKNSDLIILLLNQSIYLELREIKYYCLSNKIPFIISIGGTEIFDYIYNNRDIEEFTVDAALIFVSSNSQYRLLVQQGISKRKIKVIRPSLPINYYKKYYKLRKESKEYGERIINITYIGRLVHRKNILFILDLIKKICAYHKNVKLNIIGNGYLQPEVMERINILKINNNCLYHGALKHKDMLNILSKSNILINSTKLDKRSSTSGIPFVILESMLLGVVVVSTFTDSIREVVKDKVNGILIKNMNLKEYCEKIIKLIDDNELLRKYSKNGIQVIKSKYNINKLITKINQLIKNYY